MTHPTWRHLLALVVSCCTTVLRLLGQGLLAYGACTSALAGPPETDRLAKPACPVGYVRRGQRQIEAYLAAAAEEFRPHGP